MKLSFLFEDPWDDAAKEYEKKAGPLEPKPKPAPPKKPKKKGAEGDAFDQLLAQNKQQRDLGGDVPPASWEVK